MTKTFGLSRATTLLHFLSGGRFPIFDPRVCRAIGRLTGKKLKMTPASYLTDYIPMFGAIQQRCGAESGRPVDQALFAYGGR